MNTKFDNRTSLKQLIERMDEPEMKQVLAFAAGYEAGRMSSSQEAENQVQEQIIPENPFV